MLEKKRGGARARAHALAPGGATASKAANLSQSLAALRGGGTGVPAHRISELQLALLKHAEQGLVSGPKHHFLGEVHPYTDSWACIVSLT